MTFPVFYNCEKWIEANKDDFKPPVCNKMMHDQQLKVFYVGGPNQRLDFHIEEGEELFLMLKGDMVLRVQEKGEFKDIAIKEGEIFLLPPRIPHSPQRFENTVGMVIERERKPTEQDCIRWYVSGTSTILYECWVHVKHLGTQVASAIEEYIASEERITGRPGKIVKPQSFLPDTVRELAQPFSLKKWLLNSQQEISSEGRKSLFDDSFQTEIEDVHFHKSRKIENADCILYYDILRPKRCIKLTVIVYGAGKQFGTNSLYETFVLQMEGSRNFTINSKQYRLEAGDTLLIPEDLSYESTGSDGCYSMFVQMKTCK